MSCPARGRAALLSKVARCSSHFQLGLAMTMKTMSPPELTHESALLLTLEEISQLVAHCHDRRETLNNIVRLIQGRFHTDVCSVYLLEADRKEVVLGATI